jgi:hypothetical protein
MRPPSSCGALPIYDKAVSLSQDEPRRTTRPPVLTGGAAENRDYWTMPRGSLGFAETRASPPLRLSPRGRQECATIPARSDSVARSENTDASTSGRLCNSEREEPGRPIASAPYVAGRVGRHGPFRRRTPRALQRRRSSPRSRASLSTDRPPGTVCDGPCGRVEWPCRLPTIPGRATSAAATAA